MADQTMQHDSREAVLWLAKMQEFCRQLQVFVKNEVPDHANMSQYMSAEDCLSNRPEYKCMLDMSTERAVYMHGIPTMKDAEVSSQLQATVSIAGET